MSDTCDGTFIAFKDGGSYVRIRYRCPEGAYLDLTPGKAKFCANCGKPIREDTPLEKVEARYVHQVKIGDEWEVVDV